MNPEQERRATERPKAVAAHRVGHRRCPMNPEQERRATERPKAVAARRVGAQEVPP